MTRKKYKKPRVHKGVINVNKRGVGYVELAGYEQDIEIRNEDLNTALSGDIVSLSVRLRGKGKRQTGEIINVIERVRDTFVGTVKYENGECLVVPDNQRIYVDFLIEKNKVNKIKAGMKVVVHLLDWNDPKENPKVKIVEILGKAGEHNVEMHAIMRAYGFQEKFPRDVEKEAQALKKEITEEEILKRNDIRSIPTFTIDPKTAKDFDDAISYRKIGDDTEIGIHIADVSHYIRTGSALDREAKKRATSVYLVDRTVPMLPEKLSNEICSLNPNEDRLAFSAIITIGSNMKIRNRWFGETVIHSDKRFTYEEAQTVLDTKDGIFFRELDALNKLAKELRMRRTRKGAIDFDQDEIEFELDESGKPIKIYRKERIDTNKLIEEFMLLANQEVAKYIGHDSKKISGKDSVFVYRIHDAPDPERIEELSIFLRAIGYDLGSEGGVVKATDINKLFKSIEGHKEENLIKTATIRSMAKAVYSTKNIGHFGLAFTYYTHFTSPIRRYPDILVHRIVKSHLKGKVISSGEYNRYEKLATYSSEREAEATKAERDSIKYKQVEYMSELIGEEFDATISGVTDWGLYVEDVETKSEGLVHIRNIGDDYYTFDKKNYAIVGKRKKNKFALGDSVRVKLVGADLDARTLDFKFV